jgi:hypothetical protein
MSRHRLPIKLKRTPPRRVAVLRLEQECPQECQGQVAVVDLPLE